jgi:hypothetical protein
MPSDKRSGGRRTAIYKWRVKHGKKDVFSDEKKVNCEIFIREHQSEYKYKLKLIPPNI